MGRDEVRSRETLAMDAETLRARIGSKRFDLLTQWTDEVVGRFNRMVDAYVNEQSRVLDIGCSRGDPDLSALQRARQTVGCDPDLAGLRGNTVEDSLVAGVFEALPFRDMAFDLVVSKFVVEHLEDPGAAFRETGRVSAPDAVLALLTPNRRSPFALVSSVTPEKFKAWFKARVIGVYEEDSFPTCYRANSPGQLSRLLEQAGYEQIELTPLAGMWVFFLFCPPLARLVRLLELTMVKTPGLRHFSTQLMGAWRKRT